MKAGKKKCRYNRVDRGQDEIALDGVYLVILITSLLQQICVDYEWSTSVRESFSNY